LVLLALDEETHRRLSAQFEAREVEKTYVALVEGIVRGDAGQIDLPLAKDFANPPRHRVDYEHGRPAITHWRVIERHATHTRLELRPITGRSHQLRVHLAAIGHPIVGDPLYGLMPSIASRLCLHAERLVFQHHGTGALVSIRCSCSFSVHDYCYEGHH
jgi:tRNA pseudouridine32 synthase/23S rRNA pseudouridine746 synthase